MSKRYIIKFYMWFKYQIIDKHIIKHVKYKERVLLPIENRGDRYGKK